MDIEAIKMEWKSLGMDIEALKMEWKYHRRYMEISQKIPQYLID